MLRTFLIAVICSPMLWLMPYRPPEPAGRTGGTLVVIGAAAPANPYDSIRTDLADYLWPTDAGYVITSTFGEYRRTHFHAGIDISTGDRTGYRVFASRSGDVVRIRVSPVGYGKMVYIRHHDGYTSTYAHLERFSPAIEARASAEQRRLGRYPVDIECRPGEFPVRKGDLIAYTGDTGTGSAHLHFEIRDEHLNAVNPGLCPGLNVKDDNPPVIRKIAITPLGEQSTVNGDWHVRVFRPVRTGPNLFKIVESIYISGSAGFAIDVRDRFDGSRFLEGVYSHRLSIDEVPYYTVTLDRVPLNDAQQIGLYYDPELIEEGEGRFEKLYMDSPNDLPFYAPRIPNAGTIHSSLLREGPHRFSIVSSDIEGNIASVTGNIIVTQPPRFTLMASGTELKIVTPEPKSIHRVFLSAKRNSESGWNILPVSPAAGRDPDTFIIPCPTDNYDVARIVAENKFGVASAPRFHFLHKPVAANGSLSIRHEFQEDFVRIFLTASGDFTSAPIVEVSEGNQQRSVEMTMLSMNTCVGTFKPSATMIGARRTVARAEIDGNFRQAYDEFDLYPVVRGKTGTISFDGGNLTIAYDSLSVYKTLFLRINKVADGDGPRYRLSPEHAVLRNAITVMLRTDSTATQTGLYFRTRGRWGLLSTRRGTGGTILAGDLHRTLGEVAMLVDDTPPTISRLVVGSLARGKPTVSFRMRDDLSGVDYNELKMYIDGIIIIPEIDGEHRRAFYRFNDPLKRGSHLLSIHTKDNQGNTSTVERHFAIR